MFVQRKKLKPKKKTLCALLWLLICALPVSAATFTWTNGAGDSDWSNGDNWDQGGAIPQSGDDVVIGTQPTNDIIGIGTGIVANPIKSLTFSSALTAPLTIVPGGVEELQVGSGGITNNNEQGVTFALIVRAGANATYAGGTGGLSFNFLDIFNRNIGTAGAVAIRAALILDINSAADYGRVGSVMMMMMGGSYIAAAGSYAGNLNDTFDVTTGSFTGLHYRYCPF